MAKSAIASKVNAKAPKGVKPTARKVSGPALRYVIKVGARPGSGTNLASYTAAWLTLSGLYSGGTIPAKLARRIAGNTAIAHHTNNGNFEITEQGLRLTEQGETHFLPGASVNRNIRPDPEQVKAYAAVMQTGHLNPDIHVKNAAMVEPV